MNHWFEADEVLETILIEVLVLAAKGPLNITFALEKLANGIAEELDEDAVARSIEYANYRIGQLSED